MRQERSAYWDVRATLNMDKPGQYEFYNRGISGNRIVDVYARIKADFINLKPAFDEACKRAPADHWVVDGVHPTPAGHERIKRLWLNAFRSVMG